MSVSADQFNDLKSKDPIQQAQSFVDVVAMLVSSPDKFKQIMGEYKSLLDDLNKSFELIGPAQQIPRLLAEAQEKVNRANKGLKDANVEAEAILAKAEASAKDLIAKANKVYDDIQVRIGQEEERLSGLLKDCEIAQKRANETVEAANAYLKKREEELKYRENQVNLREDQLDKEEAEAAALKQSLEARLVKLKELAS